MVKLPWTSAREDEARLWAERNFADAPTECASRVALLISAALGCPLNELEPHSVLQSYEGFTELVKVELLLAIETEFGSSIADEEASAMTTPARIVSWASHHAVAEA